MALIRGTPARPGYTHVVGPKDSDLEYIDFGLLLLAGGETWGHTFEGTEALLVVLGGKCDVKADGEKWENIGERADVFGGKPTSVYVPPGTSVTVAGRGQVEIAVCAATADKGPRPTLIPPEQVGVRTVGRGAFQREIYDILVAGGIPAQRLLVGETYNGPGLWSSYPPHKHDVHRPPEETKLEEVYHFRVNPPQGFGFQRIYGQGFDESYAVLDRDTVTITRGFHPVAAAPGYALYYLWVLAGAERVMHPRDDEAHAWVLREA